jgi:hypothetical protein
MLLLTSLLTLDCAFPCGSDFVAASHGYKSREAPTTLRVGLTHYQSYFRIF